MTGFADRLATGLGPGWTAVGRWTPSGRDPAEGRVWDMAGGSLHRTLESFPHGHRAVLTHPHGLQLYVLPRTPDLGSFVVSAVLPAGVFEHGGVQPPPAIGVMGEPVRAAADVRRRLLRPYRTAAMVVARTTRFREHDKIVIGRGDDGQPLLNTVAPTAVRALLHSDGRWVLDPATGLCRLRHAERHPETVIQQAVLRLHVHRFDIVVVTGTPLNTPPGSRTPWPPVPPPRLRGGETPGGPLL
ncbi:hypothetical protein ACGFNX_22395 [Streptomyces sp. NPDC048723]|uniref:hypothetical protein n=1 Tax=Streptomyces sp. NPDC048723 TaxID=3365589 RepID=UPI00371407D6